MTPVSTTLDGSVKERRLAIKRKKSKASYHTDANRIKRYYKDIIRKAAAFGTTPETIIFGYDRGCEICGSYEVLTIDHDHTTNLFRGILCRKHNMAIGLLGDTLVDVKKAVEYLEQNDSNKKIIVREIYRPSNFEQDRY